MQAIKTNSTSRKSKIIAAIAAVLLFLGAVTSYAYVKNIGPFEKNYPEATTVNYDGPTDEQVEAGQETKKEAAKNDQTKPDYASSGETTTTNNSDTVTVEIPTEPKNSNGIITVKVLAQEVTSSGVCTVTLTKSGQASVTKTGKAQPLPSSSACQLQFDASKLAKGTWIISVNYKSDKSNGATSGSITI